MMVFDGERFISVLSSAPSEAGSVFAGFCTLTPVELLNERNQKILSVLISVCHLKTSH